MPFAYRSSDTDITKATRRLAKERAAHALAALRATVPPAEALHTARKDAKKLRALLKLVGPALPGSKAENIALRDAARAVSSLRDRAAMLETFDRVAPGDAALEFSQVRAALETRTQATADEATLVAGFAATFTDTRNRAKHWKLREKGFDAFESGLTDRYARAGRSMKLAAKHGTPEAFHAWRRRAKTHWFHATLLAEMAPDLMAPHVALAEDVAERLGEQHDLVNLAALLPELDLPDDLCADFTAEVTAQQTALERHALAQGARLHADSPHALARRWRIWWALRGV